MPNDAIERLVTLFERFPGIGPRQAQRFVQFLLRSAPELREALIESVQGLGKSVHQCSACFRYFSGEGKACSTCMNTKRDKTVLMVVAGDADLAAMEKSGTYRGFYFVLGGTISLASEKTSGLRIKQLKAVVAVRHKNGLKEVILALPANPEGDATTARVREELAPMIDLRGQSLRITALGRGLSTGSELEYADPETLKNALESRK